MAYYPWKVDTDGFNTSSYGLCSYPADRILTSGLGLLTHGFIWRLTDIWTYQDSLIAQAVTWTDCCEDCV